MREATEYLGVCECLSYGSTLAAVAAGNIFEAPGDLSPLCPCALHPSTSDVPISSTAGPAIPWRTGPATEAAELTVCCAGEEPVDLPELATHLWYT